MGIFLSPSCSPFCPANALRDPWWLDLPSAVTLFCDHYFLVWQVNPPSPISALFLLFLASVFPERVYSPLLKFLFFLPAFLVDFHPPAPVVLGRSFFPRGLAPSQVRLSLWLLGALFSGPVPVDQTFQGCVVQFLF